MGHLDLLAFGVEDQAVFSDDRSSTQGMYPDLSFSPGSDALPSVSCNLIQVLSPSFGGGSREQQRGPGRRVLLVTVMSFYDLDIVACQLPGEVPDYLV